MQDREKIYRIELTNEEYEFLENLKTEFCNKLYKMNDEERAEYFEQRYKNWNSEWLILKCSYKVQKNKEPYRLLACLFVAFSSNCKHFASTKPRNL